MLVFGVIITHLKRASLSAQTPSGRCSHILSQSSLIQLLSAPLLTLLHSSPTLNIKHFNSRFHAFYSLIVMNASCTFLIWFIYSINCVFRSYWEWTVLLISVFFTYYYIYLFSFFLLLYYRGLSGKPISLPATTAICCTVGHLVNKLWFDLIWSIWGRNV